jgi:hypothetical protein
LLPDGRRLVVQVERTDAGTHRLRICGQQDPCQILAEYNLDVAARGFVLPEKHHAS